MQALTQRALVCATTSARGEGHESASTSRATAAARPRRSSALRVHTTPASSVISIRPRRCRGSALRVHATATTPAPVGDTKKKQRAPPPAWLVKLSLARSPPWAFVADGSVLSIDLGGALPEVAAPGGIGAAPALSLPALCDALRKAAVDPRITGVFIRVSPLAAGWAKLGEVRAAIAAFRAAAPSKFTVAFMEVASEREYYVASACEELYIPSGAYVSLKGLSVSGTFLRGVFQKVGIEPQIKRIGKYKSAGDQLARDSMSDAQREVLTGLLSQIFEEWTTGVAAGRGKRVEEVLALVDAEKPALTAAQLHAGGWVTGLLYADELKAQLAPRTGGAADELRSVDVARYARTRPQKLGLDLGPPVVAIIRASGGISRGRAQRSPLPGGGGGGGITNVDFNEQVARVKADKRIKALLLRIDSPGGDALASDLMWRELRTLGKPVIASQSDVAASGGYYMSMACDTIVASPLTLTGSIGVITGKFNLAELYKKVGFTKEIISRGRYAQVDADNRPFTAEEEAYFDANARAAYESFRDKAALSRGMSVAAMEECAQGRVWTGAEAAQRGLVDVVGNFDTALNLAKRAAGLEEGAPVTLVDFSRPKGGLRALFGATLAALGDAAGALATLRAAQGALAAASASVAAPQAAMEPLSLGGGPDAELATIFQLLGVDGASFGGSASVDPLA
jgi:protease-4